MKLNDIINKSRKTLNQYTKKLPIVGNALTYEIQGKNLAVVGLIVTNIGCSRGIYIKENIVDTKNNVETKNFKLNNSSNNIDSIVKKNSELRAKKIDCLKNNNLSQCTYKVVGSNNKTYFEVMKHSDALSSDSQYFAVVGKNTSEYLANISANLTEKFIAGFIDLTEVSKEDFYKIDNGDNIINFFSDSDKEFEKAVKIKYPNFKGFTCDMDTTTYSISNIEIKYYDNK